MMVSTLLLIAHVAAPPVVQDVVIQSRFVGKQHVVFVVPNGEGKGRYPALLTFAGLGEAQRGNRAGARGWVEKYGAIEAIEALQRGRLTADDFQGLLAEKTVARWNRELADRPYAGLVLVCPFPHLRLGRGGKGAAAFERFLLEELMPYAEAELPIVKGQWGVDGISLGGGISMWLGFKHPERFASIGSLQGALTGERARRTKRHGRAHRQLLADRAIQLATSKGDGFRKPILGFGQWLDRLGVPARVVVHPGRHNKRYVRGPGALVMLRFHDLALGAGGLGPWQPGR